MTKEAIDALSDRFGRPDPAWSVSRRAVEALDLIPKLRRFLECQPELFSFSHSGPAHSFRDLAGLMMGVGCGTMSRVTAVHHHDPGAIERLRRGQGTVSREWKRIPKADAGVPASGGVVGTCVAPAAGKRFLLVSNAALRRMVSSLAMMSGACVALDRIKIEYVRSACPVGDRKHWVSEARRIAKRLRVFAGELEKCSTVVAEDDNT